MKLLLVLLIVIAIGLIGVATGWLKKPLPSVFNNYDRLWIGKRQAQDHMYIYFYSPAYKQAFHLSVYKDKITAIHGVLTYTGLDLVSGGTFTGILNDDGRLRGFIDVFNETTFVLADPALFMSERDIFENDSPDTVLYLDTDLLANYAKGQNTFRLDGDGKEGPKKPQYPLAKEHVEYVIPSKQEWLIGCSESCAQ